MNKIAISLLALAAVSTVAFAEPSPQFDKGYISNAASASMTDVNAFAVKKIHLKKNTNLSGYSYVDNLDSGMGAGRK